MVLTPAPSGGPDNATLYLSPGDLVQCQASGKPPPVFSWHGLDEEHNHTVEGSSLAAEAWMVREEPHLYYCEAENIIRNEEYRVSTYVTIYGGRNAGILWES